MAGAYGRDLKRVELATHIYLRFFISNLFCDLVADVLQHINSFSRFIVYFIDHYSVLVFEKIVRDQSINQ